MAIAVRFSADRAVLLLRAALPAARYSRGGGAARQRGGAGGVNLPSPQRAAGARAAPCWLSTSRQTELVSVLGAVSLAPPPARKVGVVRWV